MSRNVQNWTWEDRIFTYVNNAHLFTCPARPTSGTSTGDGAEYVESGGYPEGVGYGMNAYLDGTWSYQAWGAATMSQIQNPAQEIMMCETRSAIADVGCWWLAFWGNGEYFMDNICPQQTGVAIWAFCDGHAKALRPSQTVSPIFMWNVTNTYPMDVDGFTGEQASSDQDAQSKIQGAVNHQAYPNW
jgi:hypothetical protein